ncbi:unnamed protein product [Ilex paraguariensis]|uniref:Uncharacterized protein n=1 Tax=Ilex paraguariensis TaxID=185542 RepID=A0ABC8QNK3_9AQUA
MGSTNSFDGMAVDTPFLPPLHKYNLWLQQYANTGQLAFEQGGEELLIGNVTIVAEVFPMETPPVALLFIWNQKLPVILPGSSSMFLMLWIIWYSGSDGVKISETPDDVTWTPDDVTNYALPLQNNHIAVAFFIMES